MYAGDVPQSHTQTDQSIIESQKSLNTSHISEKPNTVKLRTDLLNAKNSLEEERELNKQNSKTIESLNKKINSLEQNVKEKDTLLANSDGYKQKILQQS